MDKPYLVMVSALILIGSILTYEGLQPYPIKDMNGDGVVDWKDYDVNVDGKVDMLDIATVASAYGSTIGDSAYNSRCDFNADGKIDDFDLNAIEDYFGEGLTIWGFLTYRAGTLKGLQLIGGVVSLVVAGVLLIKGRKTEE